MKIKWTHYGLEAYKAAGADLKARGYRAMREIKDPDCQTVLTLWTNGGAGMLIQQTWADTGDVCFYAPYELPAIPAGVVA